MLITSLHMHHQHNHTTDKDGSGTDLIPQCQKFHDTMDGQKTKGGRGDGYFRLGLEI